MKETRFISQNKEKWLESEALLNEERKDPGKLSDLFVQVVDDLSYSRTHYPNRSVRVYLNKMAREYFSIIYSHQREHKKRFQLFWLEELPQVILHCKIPLLVSLITFLLAISIGIFSSVKDPQFANAILGNEYVEMTKENIAKGDPMAVYKKGHQVDMFLGITLNNLMVAFRTYVFGIFFSIGTLAILLSNGIMVGCFQFFFIERGLFLESALTIWLHGTLEISSIVLAGGAGLTLGSGLIFPGTYSRLQAFQISAMRSLKLMLGITPILILAAIIESFLTRYTEVPDFVRLILILLSGTFIIGYFIVYPWWKSKNGFLTPLQEIRLQPTPTNPISIRSIKNNAEILKDAFVFYRTHFNKIMGWILGTSLLIATIDLLVEERGMEVRYVEEWWVNFLGGLFYTMQTPSILFVGVNTLGSTLVVYRVVRLIDQEVTQDKKFFRWPSFLQTLVIISAAYWLIWSLGGWGSFLVILTFSIILLLAYVQMSEQRNLFASVPRTWDLVSAQFGQVMGLQFTVLLMCFSFLLILSAPLIYIYTNILQWNFASTDTWSRNIVNFIELFIKILAFQMIIPIVAASIAYLYHSLRESLSAENLKETISGIGAKYQKRNTQ